MNNCRLCKGIRYCPQRKKLLELRRTTCPKINIQCYTDYIIKCPCIDCVVRASCRNLAEAKHNRFDPTRIYFFSLTSATNFNCSIREEFGDQDPTVYERKGE